MSSSATTNKFLAFLYANNLMSVLFNNVNREHFWFNFYWSRVRLGQISCVKILIIIESLRCMAIIFFLIISFVGQYFSRTRIIFLTKPQ